MGNRIELRIISALYVPANVLKYFQLGIRFEGQVEGTTKLSCVKSQFIGLSIIKIELTHLTEQYNTVFYWTRYSVTQLYTDRKATYTYVIPSSYLLEVYSLVIAQTANIFLMNHSMDMSFHCKRWIRNNLLEQMSNQYRSSAHNHSSAPLSHFLTFEMRHVHYNLFDYIFVFYSRTCCAIIEFMMTSSNGNIFRVTGLLCGEFTGQPLNSPLKRPVTRSFDVFFDLRLIKIVE